MCLSCWDADERKAALATDDCDGVLTPFMTVEELKSRIVKKWLSQKKTNHIVYKEAVINPPKSDLIWTETLNGAAVNLRVSWTAYSQ